MHDDGKKIAPARNLEEAVNSNDSLEGYVAMNEDDNSEIARRAYELYEERGREHGFHEDDWYRAEGEIRTRKSADRKPAASEPPRREFAARSGSRK
ncbi:MAG: DUF2934 domain-containing protein [Bryobacteraceae bacterium]